MHPVRMILVGGFLGAGKTTLMARAASQLVAAGQRVGLITNDQAAQLVDTGTLASAGFGVKEIAGGCFCCRFEQLVQTADSLLTEMKPDVLIGEPVGSCTDLSATVLQPMKEFYSGRFRMAPFSVLVDPLRLRQLLNLAPRADLPDSVFYILRKQLEEADIILLNKTDLLRPDELDEVKRLLADHFPHAPVTAISALTGDGVDGWLKAVLADQPAGRRIVDVDYDTYADGEAVLGWLNAAVDLRASAPVNWTSFCSELLERIRRACAARNAEIAHAKLLLSGRGVQVVANLTHAGAKASVRELSAGQSREATLIINARVHIAPQELRGIVEKCLKETAGSAISATITEIESLSPGRPTPVHRYKQVV